VSDLPLQMIDRGNGVRLAARFRVGAGPTLVFLPGYASDMSGDKASALDAWAEAQGRAMLRLDYAGCGQSDGAFADGTLTGWADDAGFLIDHFAPGAVTLVGSSMGGWIALMLAERLGERLSALVGVAVAPDFTEWGFSDAEKAEIVNGQILRPNPYGPEPTLFTLGFWEAGQASQMLDRTIAVTAPVRLLQGQCDDAVPWQVVLRTADALRSGDVQVTLIKDGDHRLSRPQDIALLIAAVATLGA